MPIVPDKYRGTTEYDQVRNLLIEAAREQRPIPYVPNITQVMDLDEPGEHMARELGQILGEISEDEHLAGRPLLSAVAYSTTLNKPGRGFYDLARELGKEFNDEDRFWGEEVQALYEVWADEQGNSDQTTDATTEESTVDIPYWWDDRYWSDALERLDEIRDSGTITLDIARIEEVAYDWNGPAYRLMEAMRSVNEHEGDDGFRGAPRVMLALLIRLAEISDSLPA